MIDPDADGKLFGLNLRYPGQYFDAESGLHYNYFRDYEAGTGRYVESDPIGLKGGLSTFNYAANEPFNYSDPFGLIIWKGSMAGAAYGVLVGGAIYDFELTSECVADQRATVNVTAIGGSVSLGGKAKAKSPAGGSGSVVFHDNNSTIVPTVFEGSFGVLSIGPHIGPLDANYTKITLGDAFSDSINDVGLELSIAGVTLGGSSILGTTLWEACSCEPE